MRRATVTVEAAALKQEILAEAKVVRLPMGTAEVVAERWRSRWRSGRGGARR